MEDASVFIRKDPGQKDLVAGEKGQGGHVSGFDQVCALMIYAAFGMAGVKSGDFKYLFFFLLGIEADIEPSVIFFIDLPGWIVIDPMTEVTVF